MIKFTDVEYNVKESVESLQIVIDYSFPGGGGSLIVPEESYRTMAQRGEVWTELYRNIKTQLDKINKAPVPPSEAIGEWVTEYIDAWGTGSSGGNSASGYVTTGSTTASQALTTKQLQDAVNALGAKEWEEFKKRAPF